MFHLRLNPRPPHVRGLGHHRPGGGFLRDREGPREVLEQHVVGLLQEAERLRCSPDRRAHWQPFAIGTQVVAIEHRGHRIDANAIDVELLEPEHQVGNKEVTNLVAAVVEDQRSPFLVLTDAGISVFIEVGAIKEGQAVGILREVARNPVDDHADAFGVTAIHEGPEFIGRSVTAGGGIPTRHLIAPGAVEGMLGDRHHLDVGEAPLLDVGNKAIGEFGVGEQASAGFHLRGGNGLRGGAVGLNPGLIR